jgi:dissimilatory sulfite reductase related protein
MPEKIYAGKPVKVNDEGYMTDPSEWTREIGAEIAKELNIVLTDKHYQLLEFLRKCQATGEQITIRKVGNSGIVDIKEFYQLFPGGPLKNASKIAGIQKPTSCV